MTTASGDWPAITAQLGQREKGRTVTSQKLKLKVVCAHSLFLVVFSLPNLFFNEMKDSTWIYFEKMSLKKKKKERDHDEKFILSLSSSVAVLVNDRRNIDHYSESGYCRGSRLLQPVTYYSSGQSKTGHWGLFMCTSVKYTVMVFNYFISLVCRKQTGVHVL